MCSRTRMISLFLLCIVFCVLAGNAFAQTVGGVSKTEAQLKFEQKAREAKEVTEKQAAAAAARREAVTQLSSEAEETISQLSMPEDTSPTLKVRGLRISGNTLIPTEELLEHIPFVYNASGMSLKEAESDSLYDFRVIRDIIEEPGEAREVSTRTIQGLMQCILSIYQDKNYGGIYVYVPSQAFIEGRKLRDDILLVNVLEASVSDVAITYYNPENELVEKGYLRESAVSNWSPVQTGDIINRKKLDDFVNLLNLNPDRYVSAVVSKGVEPNSLALGYNIYEANPWHWFVQVDNSGTKERQWNPRVGVINTNLFGIDDRFNAIYQAPWDATITENYGLYGSYDFPLAGPRLRLNLYGGYSEFDINPETGAFNFLGRGSFVGGQLRYNLFQCKDWFFDIKGSLEYVRSKVNPTLFTSFLSSDIKFWLLGTGVDIHHSDDMSNTSISLDRYDSLGGASRGREFRLSRANSESLFTIYTASASHSQYLDEDKVNRLSGTFRYITSDERLTPSKMTSFGGMYTVRGYKEYEVVADGGVLASAQYEFDLVKYEESQNVETGEQADEEKPFIRKLAPLVFFDYGRTETKKPIGLERKHVDMLSVGVGTIVELGDHFAGAVYYGFPLKATDDTRVGNGRLNVGLLMRW